MERGCFQRPDDSLSFRPLATRDRESEKKQWLSFFLLELFFNVESEGTHAEEDVRRDAVCHQSLEREANWNASSDSGCTIPALPWF